MKDRVIDIWLQTGATHIYINNRKAKKDERGNTGRTFFAPSLASVKRCQRVQLALIEKEQS